MSWFNYYGLIFTVIILIPNIIFAVKNKSGFAGKYKNKAAEISEQIGRYGCIVFMIFNIPYTYFGFLFSFAKVIYLIVNGILAITYCLIWIIMRKKSGIAKSVLLSVIPSLIFLFSGAMTASIPLLVFAVIFTVNHILISIKNTESD